VTEAVAAVAAVEVAAVEVVVEGAGVAFAFVSTVHHLQVVVRHFDAEFVESVSVFRKVWLKYFLWEEEEQEK
jgi:hypothetical protein